MGFKNDLKAGEDVEIEILKTLESAFQDVRKETDKTLREFYDIIIPNVNGEEVTLEVKNDKYVSKNMAFECLGRKSRNTGIIKTTAMFWVHVRNGKYFVWNTCVLKKYLLDLGGYIKFGGDDNATGMWVIPEEKILKECPPALITNRGSEELNKFLLKNI